jgi:hypothetical protein
MLTQPDRQLELLEDQVNGCDRILGTHRFTGWFTATVTGIDTQQIGRKPVLGGLINEYTHAA